MDTTEELTHIGLCAGYGGIELGLKRVLPTLRTIALSEIEAFAIANLVSKMETGLMDPAPIWTDLKTFPWAEFCDRVDILTGGYPCQPFSAAGKRAGKDDPRHLWPWIADGIAAMRPRVCFFENVEGHISLGLSSVISDLEEMGYKVSWGIFSAAECGAVHQRKRVFVLAESSCIGSAAGVSRSLAGNEGKSRVANYGSNQAWPSRPGHPQHTWEPPRVVGNTQGKQGASRNYREESAAISNAQQVKPRGGDCGSLRNCNRQTEPSMGGDTDGPTSGLDDAELYTACDNRTDELRLLGNGVVPATAALAFRTLLDDLQRE